jgi:hypothetical protein
MKLPESEPRRKPSKTARRKESADAVMTSRGASLEASSNDIRARIAAMAYELYQQRGGHDGHDVADWLAAEQRVMTEGEGASKRSAMM